MTFREIFDQVPREQRPAIAEGMLYWLQGAISTMDREQAKILEHNLICAFNSVNRNKEQRKD